MANSSEDVLTIFHNATQIQVPESLETTRYVVQKILVPLITAVGLLGNGLNVLVLRHPSMKGVSTNFYLFVLCLADIFYLVLTLCLSFKRCSDKNQHVSSYYFIVYARPLTDLSGNIAVWITVVFTIERYIGVRYPIKGKIWCTVGKARVISFLTFVFCLVNTFPEFFEKEIITVEEQGYKCRYTAFSEHSSYQIGYYWWFVTIFTLIPCLVLFVCNGLLIKTLILATRTRQTLLPRDQSKKKKNLSLKRKVEQHKVTLMLVTIVIIFLLCQLPWTVLLLYRTYLSELRLPEPINDLRIAGNVCNLLVQINASINFYLYSFFSRKFRRTFYNIFCRRKTEIESSVL